MIDRMSAADLRAYEVDVDQAPPGLAPADARESLEYWRGRLERLPRRQRGARREARAMVIAWEQRVRAAEIERWGGGMLGRAAGTFAVLRTLRPGALVKRVARLVPRRLVVATITVALGTAVLCGVLIGALLTALL
jgi:hypothetical protein